MTERDVNGGTTVGALDSNGNHLQGRHFYVMCVNDQLAVTRTTTKL